MTKAHRQVADQRDEVIKHGFEPLVFALDLLYKTSGQATGERAKRQTIRWRMRSRQRLPTCRKPTTCS
jgi:hypothetical protein